MNVQETAFGPMSITVTCCGHPPVTISAFCPLCGRRRAPERGACSWTNPCGHIDSYAKLLEEQALQCARPGCVIHASPDKWAPYCTDQCAALDWVDLYRARSGHFVIGQGLGCARPGCAMLFSRAAFPYCSLACRRLDWAILFTARAVSV